MEFAAMVRSVLKLSAGIQLALRSSLGRVRLPLPAGTGTHCHARSWQASPKTWEKPGDSWILLSQDALDRKKKKKIKEMKNTFSCVLCQGHLGQLRKVYSICCPKYYLYVLCTKPLVFTLPQEDKESIWCPTEGSVLILHLLWKDARNEEYFSASLNILINI